MIDIINLGKEIESNKTINFKLQIPLYLQATIDSVILQYSVVSFREDKLTIKIWNKSPELDTDKVASAIRKFSVLIAEQEEMRISNLYIDAHSFSTLDLSRQRHHLILR